nr:AAA family ATPase [Collinsella urealyticum]
MMARARGWTPPSRLPDEAISWDSEITGALIDPSWTEPEEILPAAGVDPVREISDYISALFEEDEYVGYVSEAWEREGRWLPSKGTYARTAGEILRALDACKGDIGAALGDLNPQAGAWIRFNPLDGEGVRNTNVTEFRYALVESDEISREMQLAIIRELKLPCAAIVDSGGKSIHAIVRVDAADYAEYRKRVDLLYDICRKNGLAPDAQNKNPSRLSRMPGVQRKDAYQRLIATDSGMATWTEWWDWIQEISDDLPEPESLAAAWDNLPELAPPLIEGVLRQGHKMLLAGPSKAGKSYALIELCCAIAEGRDWLGWKCAQGGVLYVNLELDPASALHRFQDVYNALGWEPNNIASIDVWNLRGRSVPMDKLAPSLIRRALRRRPAAVVIDPIYKVITGDENSADQMAAFCNQFDRIAQQVGCAVIYCHHHSKGMQGQKRSMDRASGSGVFARDPDALLDMTALEMTDACRQAHDLERTWSVLKTLMDHHVPDWRKAAPLEAQSGVVQLCRWAADSLPQDIYQVLKDTSEQITAKSRGWTAWRIEGTLREFPRFEPKDLWFEHPAHRADATGALSDLTVEGEMPTLAARRAKGTEAAVSQAKRTQREKVSAMREAVAACAADGVIATRAEVLKRIKAVQGQPVSRSMLQNWTRSSASWSPFRVSDDGRDELVEIENTAMDWDSEVDG